MSRHPELHQVATALRQALLIIERFETASERPNLPDRVREVLEHGPASTATIRELTRKRGSDVRAVLKLMQEAGQIVRGENGRWELKEDRDARS